MSATIIEAQLINDSGPTEVQISYVNAGSALSIRYHEVIGIEGDADRPIATATWASTQIATIGTCATDETVQVLWAGRVKVPKDTDVALVQGHTAWWDASTNKATTSAVASHDDDFVLGLVVDTTVASDTEVVVDLNTGPHRYTEGS